MRQCCATQGRALDYPGGAPRVTQAVDVDLLARAIAWSGETEAARNQAFNVTNGDVFTWENIWPAISDALQMKPGDAVPLSLAQHYSEWIAPWDELRRKHDLISPDLENFVGLSFQYADYSMRYGQTQPGPPSIVSTVKINQAGFTEMMDTEAMFQKWFRQARALRLLPEFGSQKSEPDFKFFLTRFPYANRHPLRSKTLSAPRRTPLPSPCGS